MTTKPPTTAASYEYILDKDGCLIPNPDLPPSHPPLYTLTGTIRAIEICGSSINLLENLQKGALFTGAVAALSGMGGMAANAGSIALYDGEDIEHVAMLLNDQLVIGTFTWLRDLKVGDEVTVVVYKADEDTPPFAYAILRKKDQLLWMPFNRDRTRHGWVVYTTKLMSLGFFGTALLLWAAILFSGRNDPGFLKNEMSIFWKYLVPFLAVFLAVIGFLSVRPELDEGDLVEDVFRALSVPKYKYFRITPYSLTRLLSYEQDPDSKKGYIFRYDLALAAHKKKYRIK